MLIKLFIMKNKNVAAVCIAKSLRTSNFHKHNPCEVPMWNRIKMVEQAWKIGNCADNLEIIEAWAFGNYYGSFQVIDNYNVNGRKAFVVKPIYGSTSLIGEEFKFNRQSVRYFEK
jgi:hypothetical protein